MIRPGGPAAPACLPRFAAAAALLWLAAAAALPALSPAARAQGIDMSHGGPIDVTARDGFEWRDAEQVVIANGDARAVRDNVTVLADQLVAHYRKKAGAAGGPSAPGAPAPGTPAPGAAHPGTAQADATPAAAKSPGLTTGTADLDNGDTEIYRLNAYGHVRILTPTDEAVGDTAVYDIDQAVLVMTGHALKLTTPTYVLTARDSLEYWSQPRMAVGRGNALVVANDGRRLSADVVVAYLKDDQAPATPGATPVAAKPPPPAPGAPPGAPQGPSAEQTGKLDRVEAFGNVEVRTQVDIVRGDRGVYVPDTGMSRVLGHVRITHGQNQINGAAGDVNMKTGIAHVINDPGKRVEGLIIPKDAQGQEKGLATGEPGPRPAAPAPAPTGTGTGR